MRETIVKTKGESCETCGKQGKQIIIRREGVTGRTEGTRRVAGVSVYAG